MDGNYLLELSDLIEKDGLRHTQNETRSMIKVNETYNSKFEYCPIEGERIATRAINTYEYPKDSISNLFY